MDDFELEALLAEAQLLPQDKIDLAREEAKRRQQPLETVIVELKLLELPDLYRAIARKQGANYVDLSGIRTSKELVEALPEDVARKTRSVPVQIVSGHLHVAMVDPTDLSALDQIQLQAGMPLELYLAPAGQIEEAYTLVYAGKQSMRDEMRREENRPLSEGTSIIKVVDMVVSQAVRDRASDIHIEPEQDMLRIRFRIDGILHEIPSPPKEWEPAIISRIKVMAGMDIAESRVPQDGHFQSKVDEKNIDFRVSTLPTIHGENVVMRVLDTASVMIGLEKLGFSSEGDLKKYEALISRPYGIILSTGPTGSGKTTTLYSALMRINTADRNIITVEDPVEYRLGLIRQVQVNPKAGITFANGLRAILRQDPDVIMVGEIRDLETAVIAIQAALTGHLVFSTLHTNDAPSSVTRLVNMGVEPFLISASLVGVMAQRLIRVICPRCKEAYEPSKAVMKKWGLEGKKDVVLYHGKGCDFCKGTGFRGRSGLYELMICDDEMRELIVGGASHAQLRQKAREKGMLLLSEDGVAKALAGITSLEEVARVCEEHIELKASPGPAELKPASAAEPAPEPAKKKVQLRPGDFEQYQKAIAGWLGDKKS